MLHIITPVYRFQNLEKIYNSIFIDPDITWHISKSDKREDLDFDFLNEDKRIKVYNVDCEDKQIYLKRNKVFESIRDGYFCLLDDDTIFHENMYLKYRELQENNYKGMLVGAQVNPDDKIRLTAVPPKQNSIDTGNVIAYSSCLQTCKWPSTHIEGITSKDFLFWESVYDFFGRKCLLWNTPISYYNKLSTDSRWKKELSVQYKVRLNK